MEEKLLILLSTIKLSIEGKFLFSEVAKEKLLKTNKQNKKATKINNIFLFFKFFINTILSKIFLI